MTENKFLQEEALNRPLRGKRKRENDDPDARLGASSVETYVSVVICIYDGQVTRGLNRNPHPRGPTVKTVEATIGSLGRLLGTDQRRENHLIQLLEGSDCSLFLWYTILPFPKLPVLPVLPAFLAHSALPALPASPAYSEP